MRARKGQLTFGNAHPLTTGFLLGGAAVVAAAFAEPAPAALQNVMLTFDEPEFTQGAQPVAYPGLAFTPGAAANWGTFVLGPDIGFNSPVTRFVRVPLLATAGQGLDPKTDPDFSLTISFAEPTPLVGFGFGYNRYDWPTDLTSVAAASVTLFDASDQVILKEPLFASRLLCCTEARFDYSDTVANLGAVSKLLIDVDENYVPFVPGVSPATPGEVWFFGIDDLSFQRTAVPIPPALTLFASALAAAGLGYGRRRIS